MNVQSECTAYVTRRHFLRSCQVGLGSMAFAALVAKGSPPQAAPMSLNPLAAKPPQFPAKAKSIIYLHMAGGPPQQELFDWKPELVKHNMQPCCGGPPAMCK